MALPEEFLNDLIAIFAAEIINDRLSANVTTSGNGPYDHLNDDGGRSTIPSIVRKLFAGWRVLDAHCTYPHGVVADGAGPSFDEALQRIRIGIKRFNSSVNSVGYHETITVAFARLIWHRRQLVPDIKDWQDFVIRYSELVSKQQPILNSYYSPEILSSEEARDSFIEPDRKPLPAVGILRMATERDAEGLLAVYAPYVERTAISFENSVPSELEFRKRVSDVLNIAPWLVYVVDRNICGYAYGTKHRERDTYRWSCDVSIYIADGYHRRGIGQILYRELLSRLKEQGFYNAFAGITLPNASSVGLHEHMEFRQIGTYHSVGFKMNRWHDVGWWQRKLRSTEVESAEPAAIRRPSELGWLLE